MEYKEDTVLIKREQTISSNNVTVQLGVNNKIVQAKNDKADGGELRYSVTNGTDVIGINATTGEITTKKVGTATVTITALETAIYLPATRDVKVTVTEVAANKETGTEGTPNKETGMEGTSNKETGTEGVPNNVTGVKLTRQQYYTKTTAYSEPIYRVRDACKISWDKSVNGDVEISYRIESEHDDFSKVKKIKASAHKYSYTIKSQGDPWTIMYIKLRVVNGDLASDYTETYKFKAYDTNITYRYKNDIYYVRWDDHAVHSKHSLCKFNIKTKKNVVICDVRECTNVWGMQSSYIYLSEGTQDQGPVYVYNRNTKKFKKLTKYGSYEGIDKKKIFVNVWDSSKRHGVYSFYADGTHGKRISKKYVIDTFVYNNSLYWYETDRQGTSEVIRLKKYDDNRNKIVNVTGWIKVKDSHKYTTKEYGIRLIKNKR